MKTTIQSEKELAPLAKEILVNAKNLKVFLFKGDLGTGKTSLIKQICKELGVKGQTSSPTYSIVNEYLSDIGKIYHIDLYRINSVAEAFEVGIEDYLNSNHYCFIEWPTFANAFLPDEYIVIEIEKLDNNSRVFKISSNF